MPYTVITHSGKAHIDEILAIAALMASRGEAPETITRMGSGEAAEMVAAGEVPEDCWVLDCGLVFDPARRLFDHHQDRELPSTALMIFNLLFPEMDGTALEDYFKLVSKVDTRGAMSLDDTGAVGESRDYFSFPQQVMVKSFEKNPRAILDIFAGGLEDRIRYEGEKKAAAEWVAGPGRLDCEEVGGVPVLVYGEQPPLSIFDGLHGIDRDIIEKQGAAVVYGFDKKDASIRTLYRTDIGHDLVDFTRSNASDPVFNHQGGFLMRFRPSDSDEWKRLVSQALL